MLYSTVAFKVSSSEILVLYYLRVSVSGVR